MDITFFKLLAFYIYDDSIFHNASEIHPANLFSKKQFPNNEVLEKQLYS